MSRRIAILAVGLAMLAAVGAAAAQTDERPRRIGILHSNDIARSASTPAFFERLRELGYVEGRNIEFLRRSARGRRDRLTAMAAELARANVEVIVAPGSAVPTALRASRTIPIVVAVAGDFVASGWARGLTTPGGIVTGFSTQAPDLTGKQLQLLKEAAPRVRRVAIVAVTGSRAHKAELRQARQAAPDLGLDVVPVFVSSAGELPAAFARMKAEAVDGALVLREGFLLGIRNPLAAGFRDAGLPAMFGHRREVTAGGLIAYGADTRAMWRGAAGYVDRILKGARPADLPIVQAQKFNLTVNLRTAKALGIAIPPSILLRATEVIE